MARRADGIVLVLGGASPEEHANLAYLTGIKEPGAALLLSSRGIRLRGGRDLPGRDYVRGRIVREMLFLPRADPIAARWGDQGSETVEATPAERVGVDAVVDRVRLHAVVADALAGDDAGPLHYARRAPARLDGPEDDDTRFVRRVRERLFGIDVLEAAPEIASMRRTKEPDEVAAIERAVAVTAEGFRAVFRAVRAGRRECEVEAELQRVYRARGAGHAFGPIVAGGNNATVLHYRSNDGPVEAGTLLLVDSGARLDGYCADVSRTLPVDGRFDARQRELYEIVLDAQRRAIACCRPGSTLHDVHAAAWDAVDRAGFGEAFVHGTSHYLGLAVHDVGDPLAPLEPGAVLTVEPGIYLPDEGLGIRIEDDVCVTDGEPRVLTAAIPSSVEAIERAMA